MSSVMRALMDVFPEFQEGAAEHGEIAVLEDDLRTVVTALEALEEAGALRRVPERSRTRIADSVRRLKTAVVMQTKRLAEDSCE